MEISLLIFTHVTEFCLVLKHRLWCSTSQPIISQDNAASQVGVSPLRWCGVNWRSHFNDSEQKENCRCLCSHVCVCVCGTTGRNIYRILFKGRQMERNELFLPGRMAYVVDLEDEYADTDIPTTLIRSKADCPTMEVLTRVLTQSLSELTRYVLRRDMWAGVVGFMHSVIAKRSQALGVDGACSLAGSAASGKVLCVKCDLLKIATFHD